MTIPLSPAPIISPDKRKLRLARIKLWMLRAIESRKRNNTPDWTDKEAIHRQLMRRFPNTLAYLAGRE